MIRFLPEGRWPKKKPESLTFVEYSIVLTTCDGDVRAFTSTDKHQIDAICEALNHAIIASKALNWRSCH